jgi:hypothetical protein
MIPHLLTFLADATPADPLDKILPWVTTFVAMVLAAVFKVQADKAKAMRLEEPVPTVPTRKVFNNVTWNDLHPIITRMDRLEKHLDEVRKEQSDQFKEILEAGSTRESRLTHHLDDVARALHSRIDDMMRDQNHQNHQPKPRTSR